MLGLLLEGGVGGGARGKGLAEGLWLEGGFREGLGNLAVGLLQGLGLGDRG